MADATSGFKVLIATKNFGKAREVESILSGLNIQFSTLLDFPQINAPDETGNSYVENAALKARYYALTTGLWALADDSGLEVDALGGKPGVFSARYAGNQAADSDRVARLLSELSKLSDQQRNARFRSAVVISDEQGRVINIAEGTCEGSITKAPRGQRGFGYDPIFIPDGQLETFAELPQQIKDQISHRAKALEGTRAFLTELLKKQT